MERIQAEIQYDTQAVYALADMQYRVFAKVPRTAAIAVCCGFLAAGVLADMGTTARIFCLMLGCLPIPSINLPAKMIAERVVRQFGGQFPKLLYRFGEDSFQIRTAQNSRDIPYQDIFRLMENGDRLFILMRDKSAYLLEKNGDFEQIKALLSRQTGLGWLTARKMSRISLHTLIRDCRSAHTRGK